jgi:uncharacterized membrane protein YfcA
MILDLPIAQVLACVAIVYIGAAVQGSLGIGLGMISSPVLALIDPDFIPVAIIVAVIPLSGTVAWVERQHIDRRGVALSLGGRVPGVILGALVATILSDTILGVMVGASVLAAVIVSAAGKKFDVGDGALIGAGLVSGFMATTTGVGGPPIALTYQHDSPVTMRSTISAFFTVGALMSLTALVVVGEVGRRELSLTLMLLPSVVAGVATARLFHQRIDALNVRPAVLVLCAFSASALLVETAL